MAIRRTTAMGIMFVLVMVLASVGMFTSRAEATGSCPTGYSCLFKDAGLESDRHAYFSSERALSDDPTTATTSAT